LMIEKFQITNKCSTFLPRPENQYLGSDKNMNRNSSRSNFDR